MTVIHRDHGMRAEDWLRVRATPPFAFFPEPMVRSLIAGSVPRGLTKGATVFRQGETATSVFIILSGKIKITRVTAKGSETVVAIVCAGETIGEAAIFCERYYPVGAEVIEPTRVLPIEGAEIISQLKKKPNIALQIFALASHRIASLVEQMERMKCLSGEQRVADFLLQMCPYRSGACSVELPCEKQLIASFLAITPQTFSRALVRLRALGVSVERDTVRIADVQRLLEFARA